MKPVRTVTPVLRYRDPNAAAEWLCKALGFERADTAKDARGGIHYISLRLGDCVVLVCPLVNAVLRDLMVQPEDVGGANTQICYLTVHDLAAHFARSEAAGATIVLSPQDDGAAARFYMCRDPEGHLWSIGTQPYGAALHGSTSPGRSRFAQRFVPLAAVLLIVGGWILLNADYRMLAQTAGVAIQSPSSGDDRLAKVAADELARRLQLEMMVKEATEKLEQERAVSAELRQKLGRVQASLEQAQLAKESADRAVAAARAAGAVAEQSSKYAVEAFAQERAAANATRDAHMAKIAEFEAAIVAERERGAQALAQERAATKTAGEARDASSARIAELEAAVLAERELRVAAEIEVVSLRERLAGPRKGAVPDDAGQEKEVALPVLQAAPQDSGDGKAGTASPQLDAAPPVETKAGEHAASACALAVQDKIAFGHRGSKTWDHKNLERLCKGAETSAEPAKCFGQLMTGKVSWGGGKIWKAPNALALCGGTRNAGQTLECFSKELAGDQPWRAAIGRCRAK